MYVLELALQTRKSRGVVVEGQMPTDLLARRRHHLGQPIHCGPVVVERKLGNETRQRGVFSVERELPQDDVALLGQRLLDRRRQLRAEPCGVRGR